MKVSKNFTIYEFIFPELAQSIGLNPIWYIDPKVISMAQFLRSRFNQPVTINDWSTGGGYTLSGLRPFLTRTGARLSLHKFGKAIDVKIRDIDPIEVQEDIIQNQEIYMDAGVTAIEKGTPTWTHLDCRNSIRHDILIIPFNNPLTL